MDSLTDRLTFLMGQISDKKIAEIIDKDRCEKLKGEEERKVMLSYRKKNLLYQNNEINESSVKIRGSLQKERSKDGSIIDDGEHKNKMNIITVGSIWGASKHWKDATDKDGNNGGRPKDSNKFLKAARTAVLMRQVAYGREICTCESLDSHCKIHDS